MRFYLDDDSVDKYLIALLRKAGHEVVLPIDVKMSGVHDALHLAYAATHGLVLVTRNRHDFSALHHLVLTVGGHHAGILAACFDNNRKRDMKPKEIAAAIAKVVRAIPSFVDSLYTLNEWR